MNSVKNMLPPPNTMCRVRTIPHLDPRKQAYKFVTYSDGGYFWDNGIDEILQDTEVTHWNYYEKN